MMYKGEIHTEILENQRKVLQAAMSVDSTMAKRLRELIAEELKAARGRVVASIKFKNGDPRQTSRSVRRSVYQKILGGNINILNSPKGTARHTNTYEAPRKVYPGMGGQRGGNRQYRSQRTQDILTLAPQSRGFILRLTNSGTAPRYVGGRNVTGKGNRTNFFKLQAIGNGYRGSIGARNFFTSAGRREIEKATANLADMIEQEYNKLFK